MCEASVISSALLIVDKSTIFKPGFAYVFTIFKVVLCKRSDAFWKKRGRRMPPYNFVFHRYPNRVTGGIWFSYLSLNTAALYVRAQPTWWIVAEFRTGGSRKGACALNLDLAIFFCRSFSPPKTRSLQLPSQCPVISLLGISVMGIFPPYLCNSGNDTASV